MDEMAQKDLRRVARARDQVEQAEKERVDAIVAARRSGETLRDIAEVAGLSHQRIHQILRKNNTA